MKVTSLLQKVTTLDPRTGHTSPTMHTELATVISGVSKLDMNVASHCDDHGLDARRVVFRVETCRAARAYDDYHDSVRRSRGKHRTRG
jgi:hypothetical protein